MSIQSNVGRLMLDIRDVCAQRVSQTLVVTNRDKNLGLSDDQLRDIAESLKLDLAKSFENGLDAVQNEFKRDEAEKKKKAAKKK